MVFLKSVFQVDTAVRTGADDRIWVDLIKLVFLTLENLEPDLIGPPQFFADDDQRAEAFSRGAVKI